MPTVGNWLSSQLLERLRPKRTQERVIEPHQRHPNARASPSGEGRYGRTPMGILLRVAHAPEGALHGH
ncbi:MAG: hypothetical protein V7K46_12950 [Nostoc sp.]